MYPNLTFISGTLNAKSFQLSADEVCIGRDASNDITIDDVAVSRRHCLVRKENGRFKLIDLDSHNGTFLNDVPIKEGALKHGDRIRIGSSVLLILLHDAPPDAQAVGLDDGMLVTKSAVRLRLEDVLRNTEHDLGVLFNVSQAITAIRDLDQLKRRLLEHVFEVVPARRGAILLMDASGGEVSSSYGRHRDSNETFRVSRTVALQVMREGVAVLSNEVEKSETFGQAGSLAESRVRALLCAPLVAGGRTMGLIYLDTADPTVTFGEGHLQFLTVVANIAAVAIENVRYMEELRRDNQQLREHLLLDHRMIGESKAMRAVYDLVARVAATNSTVLILGESGTGKELAAHAIHASGARAGRPFVAINCASLTETLLESELFGHERGAFTGAVAQKKGKLEVADGGTVFLDEVGELAPALQAKLLRVLQTRQFERVGGTHPVKVDIRITAATNRDLEAAVMNKTFREDLYYRLKVVTVTMPPLRARREDIPLLANYFTARHAERCKRAVIGVSTAALSYLINYDWPGNVRELDNAVERAVVLGSTELIQPEDLPENVIDQGPSPGVQSMSYYDALREAKKQLVMSAIEKSSGNYNKAAQMLGVHPNNLHRLIRNLDLRKTLKK